MCVESSAVLTRDTNLLCFYTSMLLTFIINNFMKQQCCAINKYPNIWSVFATFGTMYLCFLVKCVSSAWLLSTFHVPTAVARANVIQRPALTCGSVQGTTLQCNSGLPSSSLPGLGALRGFGRSRVVFQKLRFWQPFWARHAKNVHS